DEEVRCTGVRADGPFAVTLPRVEVPLTYRFRDGDRAVAPKLDTVILQPDERRVILAWRGLAPLGRKLKDLREVLVGPQPRPADGKKRYVSLAELATAQRGHSGAGPAHGPDRHRPSLFG